MSFRFRFFVTFIVLETLFMLGIVVLNFNSLERESKKLIEEKTQVASTMFSEIVATPLLVYDLATVDDAADSFVNMEGTVQVQVIGLEGEILSQAYDNNEKYNADTLQSAFAHELEQQKEQQSHTFKVNDQSYLSIKDKLEVDGSVIAFVRFVFDISRSVNALESNAFYTWLLAGIEIAISTIVALNTGFRLAMAVETLSGVANEIAHNRPVTIPEYKKKGDEVERLYQSMHLMQQNIKKREDELVMEREKALAASKTKSEFLAVMSHEIRTPINGMTGALNLIERDKLDSNVLDQVDTALASSELLLTVINDLLDYSKIEAGKFNIKNKPFSVDQLINEIDTVYSPLFGSTSVAFRIEGRESVADVYCLGDRIRIKQILCNYLNNAMKFTSRGAVKLVVKHLENGDFKFAVEDTGIGIKLENIDKLFRDFSQVDRGANRQFGGSGLGLVISKKLAEMMNGCVDVKSVEGEGSVFSVSLQLETVSQSAFEAEHLVSAKDDQPGVNARVLVVEDNLINQKVVTRILEKAGCNVSIANNGAEALDMLDEGDFDVVLMDCQMPVMDGLTATKELRQRGNEIPIIALTANARDTDREACMKAGMDAFVAKPFQPTELFSIIQSQVVPAPA